MDLVEVKKRNKSFVNRHPWEQARLKIVKKYIDKYIDTQKGHVLDIGCGDSYVVENLADEYKSMHFSAVDIAFDDQMIQQFRAEHGHDRLDFYQNFTEALSNTDQVPKCVLLLDVIEHIENDIDFLKQVCAHEKISNETCFIITVPAFQSLFCAHDTFLEHYRRYTNSMLKRHIEEAGMETVEVGYFFTSLLFPRILEVIKEKIAGAKETSGLVEWNGGKGITAAIKTVLLIDYGITSFFKKIGISVPGLSNYIICRKRR